MIGVIIQARMGSKRLPGKVMMNIRDKPILFYVINQVKQSKLSETIIVATTDLPEDEVISQYAKSSDVNVFCGNSEDVLNRFNECAKKFNLDIIVRISSDSPLIDYTIIDSCIEKFQKNNLDYLSNTIKKINNVWTETYNGFPIGLAVEVFTISALEEASKNSNLTSDREHVTEYFWKNPSNFKIGNFENNADLSNYRLVVDYQTDFEKIKLIIEYFPSDAIFTLKKLEPELYKIYKDFDN
jgi:spore coat polysaccharide biosynthesis protein SpsF